MIVRDGMVNHEVDSIFLQMLGDVANIPPVEICRVEQSVLVEVNNSSAR